MKIVVHEYETCRLLDFWPVQPRVVQPCYGCSALLGVPWLWAAAWSSCLLDQPAPQIPPNFLLFYMPKSLNPQWRGAFRGRRFF
jgi:hypothetical protein